MTKTKVKPFKVVQDVDGNDWLVDQDCDRTPHPCRANRENLISTIRNIRLISGLGLAEAKAVAELMIFIESMRKP